MHPLLENLSIFTWTDILQSDERCASFLGNLGLIPEKTDSAPTCPRCSGPMKVRNHTSYAIRWQWICKKHKSKTNRCSGFKNPLDGTFFENNKMPLMDVLGLMFGYFLKFTIKEMQDHLNCWRKSRNQKQISNKSVISLHSRFKEIIYIALRKKGEFSESLEKADLRKLFQKYSKTIEVEPFFRNIVFQFLMDIKSEYPCLGSKKNNECIDMSPLNNSSASVDIHVKNKNNSNSPALTNVSLSSVSLGAPKNENMNVKGVGITNTVPVLTRSTTTTSTVSQNSRLPSCASVCKDEEISSAGSVIMDIQNAQTSNYNTVAIANNYINSCTDLLENPQILNNSTATSVNIIAPNNVTTGLETAQISSSKSDTIENLQGSINNTTAIGMVQTSNNNSSTVSSLLSFNTDFLGKNNFKESTNTGAVFFSDENMDIETEVIIETE